MASLSRAAMSSQDQISHEWSSLICLQVFFPFLTTPNQQHLAPPWKKQTWTEHQGQHNWFTVCWHHVSCLIAASGGWWFFCELDCCVLCCPLFLFQSHELFFYQGENDLGESFEKPRTPLVLSILPIEWHQVSHSNGRDVQKRHWCWITSCKPTLVNGPCCKLPRAKVNNHNILVDHVIVFKIQIIFKIQ